MRKAALYVLGKLPSEVLAWLDPLDTETAQAHFLARYAALSGLADPAGLTASGAPG